MGLGRNLNVEYNNFIINNFNVCITLIISILLTSGDTGVKPIKSYAHQ